jgi:hypothetical protein
MDLRGPANMLQIFDKKRISVHGGLSNGETLKNISYLASS